MATHADLTAKTQRKITERIEERERVKFEKEQRKLDELRNIVVTKHDRPIYADYADAEEARIQLKYAKMRASEIAAYDHRQSLLYGVGERVSAAFGKIAGWFKVS